MHAYRKPASSARRGGGSGHGAGRAVCVRAHAGRVVRRYPARLRACGRRAAVTRPGRPVGGLASLPLPLALPTPCSLCGGSAKGELTRPAAAGRVVDGRPTRLWADSAVAGRGRGRQVNYSLLELALQSDG